MTDVSSLASSLTASAAGTAASGGVSNALTSSSLSMNDFLKLMTTQLQTQDPFNPMDNTQMASQLAQFSSVAGISEMNQSLQSLASDLSGSRIGDAASWIGKKALVAGSTATPLADGSYAGQVTLPSAASAVTVSLVDASGAVVHSQGFGAQPSGAVPFTWDGKAADGTAAGGGPLKVVVTAQDSTGAAVAATTATWAAIGGVQSPATGTTKLVTPLGSIDPATALQLA